MIRTLSRPEGVLVLLQGQGSRATIRECEACEDVVGVLALKKERRDDGFWSKQDKIYSPIISNRSSARERSKSAHA